MLMSFLVNVKVFFSKNISRISVLSIAQRAQQDGHRQFAAAIDTREHAVLRIELEVEPGAAIRNHARGEQHLARRMRLAAVVIEEHARRTVQLRHDDALGAVDDEGAVVGHQRHFAQIDLLLADVLDRLLGAGRFLVVDDQAHFHAQRCGKRQAAQLAFLDVEDRLAEAIAYVFQRGITRVADDRKHGVERRMQTDVPTLVLRLVLLQELAVGVELDRQQIRHVEHRRTLAEILTYTLFLGKGIGHVKLPSLHVATLYDPDCCSGHRGGWIP